MNVLFWNCIQSQSLKSYSGHLKLPSIGPDGSPLTKLIDTPQDAGSYLPEYLLNFSPNFTGIIMHIIMHYLITVGNEVAAR